jgi:hypothetical protein
MLWISMSNTLRPPCLVLLHVCRARRPLSTIVFLPHSLCTDPAMAAPDPAMEQFRAVAMRYEISGRGDMALCNRGSGLLRRELT